MRLISLHINNFGKLQNYSIDFSSNPTIILEDNGWGKSTLAAFIKVMFYGFSGESKRALQEREREKYRPWNKGVYGGRIVYESEGRRFEISKVFGDKEKDDDCVLCDADTRLRIVEADAAHLGISLFSLDERAFMRSVFIAQNDVRVHEDGKDDIADGISAKIGNLSDATDDVNRYEIVMGHLNDALNKMSPKRATGSIKQMDAHIGAINNNLREEESVKDSVNYLEGQIREEYDIIKLYKDKRDTLEASFAENAKRGELVARKEAFTHMWNQYEIAKEGLDKMSESYVNGLPKERELNEKLEKLSERNMLNSSIESKQISLDYMIKMRAEEIERAAEKKRYEEEKLLLEQAEYDKHRKTGIVLLGIAIVLIAIGASVSFVFNYLYIGIGIAALGLILFIIGIIVMPFGNKGRVMEEAPKEKELLILENTASIEIDTGLLPEIMNGDNFDTLEIKEIKEQISSSRERVLQIEKDIQEFLNYYQFTYLPENVESSLYDIRQQIMVYNTKVEDVEEKRAAIKAFEAGNDMTAIMNVVSENMPEEIDITDERALLEERIRVSNEKIRRFRGQLDESLERLRQMADLKEEMNNLIEQRNISMHKFEMLSLTRDYLKVSKEKFSAKYRKPLLDGFKKYYSYLSDEESSEFQIDANIHMTRREWGEARDSECYSSGNRDLFDICLRMALVDAMYTDEKPFVILDDPFVNLDKKKTEKAMSFLNEVSKDYQVIYFTCHESRA